MNPPPPAAARGDAGADTVSSAVTRLRAAGRALPDVPWESLARDLDRVARAWLDPRGPLRAEALARIPPETGLSRQGVSWALDTSFEALTFPCLAALVRAELGDPGVLDGPLRPARGLSAHVQAGNVFTAVLPRLFAGLLARCPAGIKPPSGQPAFSDLLARSFRSSGGALAGAVEVIPWRGGEPAVEAAFLGAADVVVAYGGDRAVSALRARARPDAAFYGFPHRVSLAVVDRASSPASPDLLEGLALDVLAYDQRGCLSPQVLYVEEGGPSTPRDFAEALARTGFPAAAARLRPAPLPEDVAAERLLHLEAARFEGDVWEGEGWAVCSLPDSRFVPSACPRVLDVRPIPHLLDLAGPLAAVSGRLQGVAAAVDAGALPALARVAGALGASRVCRPGDLQRPPLTWPQDGYPVLLPFLRMLEVGR